MNLSEHFTLEEGQFSSTAVRLCLSNTPDQGAVESMQQAAIGMELVRHALGDKPLHVDSWYRCPALNRAVGGAANSAHMYGWAVDFICPAFGTPYQVVNALVARSELRFDQLIQEGNWVHISFDPKYRRQILTAHFGPGGTTYS